MGSSLDILASYLSSFPIIKSLFQDLSDEQFNLLTFPYDYCDNRAKFSETCLPDISKFYNKLNDYNISEEDYAHACYVWQKLNFNCFGEYSDLSTSKNRRSPLS